MKQFSLFIHLMLSVLLFSSCGGRSKTASVIEAEKAIPLRYAENLNLSATEDYTIARLRNPWDTTRILHTYVLVGTAFFELYRTGFSTFYNEL